MQLVETPRLQIRAELYIWGKNDHKPWQKDYLGTCYGIPGHNLTLRRYQPLKLKDFSTL